MRPQWRVPREQYWKQNFDAHPGGSDPALRRTAATGRAGERPRSSSRWPAPVIPSQSIAFALSGQKSD